MTRKRLYFTEQDVKNAIKKSKTKYMVNRCWYCDICNNNKDYKLAGKWTHIKSLKHQKSVTLKNE